LVKVACLSHAQGVVDAVNQVKSQFNLDFVFNKKADVEETETLVAQAQAGGADVILSFGIPLPSDCGHAHPLVIPVEPATFGTRSAPERSAVALMLRSVELFARSFTMARRLKATKEAILENAMSGIIVVDERGNILHINESAKSIIDCRDKTVIGLYLLNVFPAFEKEELDSVLTKGTQLFSSSIKVRTGTLIVKADPIDCAGEIIGAVLFLQRGKTTPKRLSRSQSEMGLGFVAHQRFDDFSYSSLVYDRLVKQAKAAAYTDAPILLRGEEGTELLSFAQCIHNESSRHGASFVEVECDAWTMEHIDEILFGEKHAHEESLAKKCIVTHAEGGTLFLSHIERLSNELQYRVCRLIKGQYILNGDSRSRPADVRVIAAACQDLKELAAAGKFRSDLYYALNVLSLEIPPLRERKEDIQSWIEFFFDYYCEAYSKPVILSKGALRSICAYDWPGNMTQLENFCQRIILMTPHRSISEAFVRSELDKTEYAAPHHAASPSPAVHRNKEAQKIVEALRRNRGNRIKTAGELGISKTTLWRLMQKYGITEDYIL